MQPRNATQMTPIATRLSRDMTERRCAHIIDLCTVRANMGAMWKVGQDAVRARLEATLSRRLSPNDYFEKLDEVRYLIVTPDTQGEDAAILMLRVLCEFMISLNGSCDLSDICIDVALHAPGGEVMAQALRPDMLASLIERAMLKDIVLPPALRRSPVVRRTDDNALSAANREIVAHHQFEPVWHARHEAITTYLCMPSSIACADDPATLLKTTDLTVRERAKVELAGLMKGASYLTRMVERGDRFLLGVPVSFETLCSPFGRMDFMGACRGMPAAYRQYLLFMLTGVPLGVAQSRLSELAMLLRPFGRIIATVANGSRSFTAYAGLGLCGLAIDLALTGEDTESTRADIVHLAVAARNMRWGAMALNINDQQQLGIVNAADFQLLHGAEIAAPSSEPRRMAKRPVTTVVKTVGGSEDWF